MSSAHGDAESASREERNKQIVVDAYERMNNRDLTVFDEHPGLLALAEYMPIAWEAIPDFSSTIEQIIAENDLVAIQCIVHGTHSGSGFLGQPTGESLRFPGAWIDRVEDGKIVQHSGATHWITVLYQIGVLPISEEHNPAL
ncbi:ester cyclase [Nocardia colli]|nr:ester cyclase [Nocardia colli]